MNDLEYNLVADFAAAFEWNVRTRELNFASYKESFF